MLHKVALFMPPSKKKDDMNILFDLDGTLTDPYQGITTCISHALVSLGRHSPSLTELQWCIGPPLKNSFAKLLASDDHRLAEEALCIYRERYSSVGLYENKVYKAVPETLQALLDMGHTLFVATSKPVVFARRIIEHFDLDRYFKRVYGSELNGTRNDKTHLIAFILQKEAIAASDAFMIGDRKYDIIGAKDNGISGIGVLWGYGTKDELVSSGAQICLSRPRELTAVFKRGLPGYQNSGSG
jgi:phosphoglycolate phosphatase